MDEKQIEKLVGVEAEKMDKKWSKSNRKLSENGFKMVDNIVVKMVEKAIKA